MSTCSHDKQTKVRTNDGNLIVCKTCLINLEFQASAPIKSDLAATDRIPVVELVKIAKGLPLNGFEKSFIDSLSERVEKYGDKVMISEKQQAVLDKIQKSNNISFVSVDVPF
jgi:hypothetical protein